MKNISETMWDIWEGGDFTGDKRPLTRAEISKHVLKKGDAGRTILFNQANDWTEVPNIQTVTIERRLGQDSAQMSMTLLNQTDLSAADNLDETHGGSGPTRRELADLGSPGFYTFRRGILDRDGASPWGHGEDATWVDMLIPNRVIRTFQGYGTDGAGLPSLDTRLALTGIWLIDSVEYASSGNVNIQCRDMAKLLIEQRLYPPIIPIEFYPLEFCSEHTVTDTETYTVGGTTSVTEEASTGPDVGVHVSSGWDSSVAPWYGYNASLYGHRASHAFDGDPSTYWLSVGNSGPNMPWSYEWIEANTRGEPVNQVYFKPRWGGYVVYVGVKVGGVWQGTDVVPYGHTSEPAYPNGSNIRYVKKVTIPSGEAYQTIDLTDVNGDPLQADAVRLVFTNLQDSDLGTYQYRAGVYDMQVRLYTPPYSETISTETEEEREVTTIVPGNLDDYTDIIKVLCAWSGFWWPLGGDDPILQEWGIPTGRAWGDFMYSGAYPVEPPCIPSTFWDNKSVMDGINQIKEILGFIFYIDSTGGVVWRPPNIWRTGNYLTGVGYVGEDTVRTVDENRVLLDYGVTIDDQNLRSEIVVVSAEDPTLSGAFQPSWGQNPDSPSTQITDLSLLGGQERVMLVPNYPFQTLEEVEKFAFLVSLWIHWSYRKSRFRIPGNPAFEPDDQIRIYERVSSELFIHYIQGTSSVMDLNAGTWYMDIDTHWLGNGPDAEWVVSIEDLQRVPAFIAYLIDIGQLTDEVVGQLPDDWWPEFEVEIPEVDWRIDPEDVLASYPDLVVPPVEWVEVIDSPYIVPPSTTTSGSYYVSSNAFMTDYWGPHCQDSQMTTITWLYPYSMVAIEGVTDGVNTHVNQTERVSIRIDRRAVTAYRKLAQIICEDGYKVYATQTGGYNCRHIDNDPARPWSNHAWGTAVDVNWALNLQGSSPSSAIRAIGNDAESRVRTGNGQVVFRWGGTFSTPDGMHFEMAVKPSDLATGVVLS